MAKHTKKTTFNAGVLKMDSEHLRARQESFRSSHGTKFDSRPHRQRTRAASTRHAISEYR